MLFSPLSKEKALLMPEVPDEIDLLIATDCISEGQNLQDCDYLINYDIHWNPVRIIQRFGRIDRIGSKNASIQLVNYWPDISLDEYIRLKERVESRMVIADVTATGDDNPADGRANDLAYRKEQLRRMQEEVIELEDLKTGVSITDLGLNDFRMDLLNYVKTNGDLARLPSGMHAVVPAAPERGLAPGVIFALRNRNESVNVEPAQPASPLLPGLRRTWTAESIVPHTEVKRLLDLVRSVCQAVPIHRSRRHTSPSTHDTSDGREMSVYSDLLDRRHPLHRPDQGREGPRQPLHRPEDHRAHRPVDRPRRLRTDRFLRRGARCAPRQPESRHVSLSRARPKSSASCPRTRFMATRSPAAPSASDLSTRSRRSSGVQAGTGDTQPAGPAGVEEIQVFEIALKTGELREDVLRTIDRAIPSLLFFELTFEGQVRFTAAYKRLSEASTRQPVVDSVL